MKKFTLLFLVMFPLSSYTMGIKWRTQKLSELLEESKEPAKDLKDQKLRELKQKFVHINQDKYELQQQLLSKLYLKTGGKVAATTDPELAQEDPNKFLSLGSLHYTSQEIDERWKRIQEAARKNKKSKTTDTDWQNIGMGSYGIVSVGILDELVNNA